jgi:hypothetical protein
MSSLSRCPSEDWGIPASEFTTASMGVIPSHMPSQSLSPRQTWPLTNLFPPYNVEKVRALNQWFIY